MAAPGCPDAQSLAGKGVEDVTLLAGAAIGALDAVVRRQERWAGAWRQRLALAAAAVTVKQVGRAEDEAALRDAFLLTTTGDDVGPAGWMFLGWRRLAARPTEDLLTGKGLGAMLDEFGHAPDDEMVGDLAGELRALSAGGMVGMVTGAFIAAELIRVWASRRRLARRCSCRAVPGLATRRAAAGRREYLGCEFGPIASRGNCLSTSRAQNRT